MQIHLNRLQKHADTRSSESSEAVSPIYSMCCVCVWLSAIYKTNSTFVPYIMETL